MPRVSWFGIFIVVIFFCLCVDGFHYYERYGCDNLDICVCLLFQQQTGKKHTHHIHCSKEKIINIQAIFLSFSSWKIRNNVNVSTCGRYKFIVQIFTENRICLAYVNRSVQDSKIWIISRTLYNAMQKQSLLKQLPKEK